MSPSRVRCRAPPGPRQPVAAPGADQRHDIRAARQNPGDGDLGDRRALGGGDGAQRLDQREVAVDVLAAEAGRMVAEIARRRPVLRPVAADETARKHAIGGDADAELAAGGQDVVLDAARDQRIFDLQVDDGVDGGGPADASRRRLRTGRCGGRSRPSPGRRWRRRCLRSARWGRAAPAGRCRHSRCRGAAACRRAKVFTARGRASIAEPGAVRPALRAELDADRDLAAVAALAAPRAISSSLWPMP